MPLGRDRPPKSQRQRRFGWYTLVSLVAGLVGAALHSSSHVTWSPAEQQHQVLMDTTTRVRNTRFLQQSRRARADHAKPRVAAFAYGKEASLWPLPPASHKMQTHLVAGNRTVTASQTTSGPEPVIPVAPMPSTPSETLKPECVVNAEWQTVHYPTCNLLHELSSWNTIARNDEHMTGTNSNVNSSSMCLLGEGYFRHVWLVHDDALFEPHILKTLRNEHPTHQYHMDRGRDEAAIMQTLTASPYIANIYGYCSTSGLFEMAERGDMKNEIFGINDQVFTPLRKLQIGRYTWQWALRRVIVLIPAHTHV